MRSLREFLNLSRKGQDVQEKKKLLAETRYVVIDTELTGLDDRRDSIVSLGAVRMSGGRIEVADTFYRLVRPETDLTAGSIIIHEITPSELEEQPDIKTVLSEFLAFCGDDVIVGFCVSIDLGFIRREMKRFLDSALNNAVLDTAALYEYVRTRIPSHGSFAKPPMQYTQLYDIAKCLGIPVSRGHNALMDAFLTAQIFQRLIPMFLSAGVEHIGSLLKITEKGGEGYRV